MNLRQLKTLQASLLRGAFCAVWIFGFILTFYEWLYAILADTGSPEKSMFMIHALVCGLVGTMAAIVHAHLIRQATDGKRN
jgi:hypothetical protein